MTSLEEIDAKVKGELYGLTEKQLRDLCTHLKIDKDTEHKHHYGLVKHINRYLDSEEVEQTPDNGKKVLEDLFQQIKDMNGTPDDAPSTATTSAKELKAAMDLATAMHRKEFKIHGQIGTPGQVEKLTFQSLIRQIEDGISRGYTQEEIVSAVIRAVGYGMPLRELLEGKAGLTLPKLRRILRSHYNEKDALTSYQELTTAVQHSKETAQEFLIRLMNTRQRILFTSQEDQSPVKYEYPLVQSTFLLTLQTALDDTLKMEMKPVLENPGATDEDLLESMNYAVNLEEKRSQKRRSKVKIQEVRFSDQTDKASSNEGPKDSKRNNDIAALAAGFADLKALVLAIQENQIQSQEKASHHQQFQEPDQPPRRQQFQGHDQPSRRRGGYERRERGCEACRQEGRGDQCTHCFKCGEGNHFARGCKLNRSAGNGYGAPRGDRR
jgi:hypothetical protein